MPTNGVTGGSKLTVAFDCLMDSRGLSILWTSKSSNHSCNGTRIPTHYTYVRA